MEDWNEHLIFAAAGGDIEDFKLCIQSGADIDYQDVSGETALMLAASRGHLDITRLLLDSRCNTDITKGGGWTALMFVAEGGHLEITRLLLDSGCNTDITGSDGETALHIAAGNGHLQITICLVEQGGFSPLIKTHEGKTPYDLAAEGAAEEWTQGQYKEVMEYLQTVMSEKSPGVNARQGVEVVI